MFLKTNRAVNVIIGEQCWWAQIQVTKQPICLKFLYKIWYWFAVLTHNYEGASLEISVVWKPWHLISFEYLKYCFLMVNEFWESLNILLCIRYLYLKQLWSKPSRYNVEVQKFWTYIHINLWPKQCLHVVVDTLFTLCCSGATHQHVYWAWKCVDWRKEILGHKQIFILSIITNTSSFRPAWLHKLPILGKINMNRRSLLI